jgi:hypothetical protein
VETNGLTIGIGRGLSTGFALGVTAGIGYITARRMIAEDTARTVPELFASFDDQPFRCSASSGSSLKGLRMRKLLAALALMALSTQAAPAIGADALTRTSNERSVKVEVTPLNLTAGGETLDFRVVLETHSVELNYDLAKIAVLSDDRGNTYRPSNWQGPAGGHHVEGVLRFSQARRIMDPRPGYLELQIEGVAGVSRRSFRWESKAFN